MFWPPTQLNGTSAGAATPTRRFPAAPEDRRVAAESPRLTRRIAAMLAAQWVVADSWADHWKATKLTSAFALPFGMPRPGLAAPGESPDGSACRGRYSAPTLGSGPVG